jgi:uncharacterized repeat protein (TIGR01451 family)
VCTFPIVPAGTFATVEVEASVDASTADGSVLVNGATVVSSTSDPDPTNDSDDHPTVVEALADLSILKTVSLDPFVPGQPLTYTLLVRNNGPSDAASVTVTDPVPTGLSVSSATASAGVCSVAVDVVTCDAPSLAAGDQMTVTIVADTDPSIVDTVTNTATVASTTDDPNPGDESSTATTDPLPSADLEIVKSVSAPTVVAGDTLTYSIVVTNRGGSTAFDVEAADALPAGLEYVDHSTSSGAATCGWEAGTRTVRCTAAPLAPDASFAVDIDVRVDASFADGSVVSNTAGVTSTTPDPDPDNNTSTVPTDVVAEVDIAIDKTLVTSAIVPGDTARYELVVTNAGPSDAQAVTVADTVPAGLTISGVLPSTGTCSHDGVTLTCDLGTLAAGGSLIVLVDVSAAPDLTGTVTNTATATTTTTDIDPDNNSSTTVDPVEPRADIVTTKTTVTPVLVPGQTVEYVITVTNAGPSSAETVVMDDPLPEGLIARSATTSQGTCVIGASVRCDLGGLALGDTVTIVVAAAIAADVTGQITNVATSSSDTTDPDLDNNSAETTDELTPSAELSVVKTVAPAPFVPGEDLTYTITVANEGPSDAADVTMSDTMPDGLTPRTVETTSGTCSIEGGSVRCDLGAVAPGAAVTITIVAGSDPTIDAAVTNSVVVATSTPESDPDNNTDTATSTPDPAADVRVIKSAAADAVGGETLAYTIDVTNLGPSTAGDVVLTDVLPVGTAFVSASEACVDGDGVVTCDLGDLAPGSTRSIEVVVLLSEVADPVTVTNTATVSTSTPDTDDSNDSSSFDTTVLPVPASLVGVVWNDADGDGVRDPDESGIPGVTVTVTGDPDGDGVDTVIELVTDADGAYATDLPAGDWTVTVDASTYPFGLAPTTPLTDTVTVPAGGRAEVETGLAFGAVTGTVWLDLDGDGVIDAGETGLSDVRVEVVFAGEDGLRGTADDMTFFAVTRNGVYVVDGVPVGQAGTVRIDTSTLPSGVSPTFDEDGSLDHATSVIVTEAGGTATADFGYRVVRRIPVTGSSPGTQLQLALILLVLGGTFLAVSRRRRQDLP